MKIENYDARYFKLAGLPYRKKDYVANFKSVNTTGVANQEIDVNIIVDITNKFNGQSIVGGGIKVREFQNSSNVNYSSLNTFVTDLQTILDDNTSVVIGPRTYRTSRSSRSSWTCWTCWINLERFLGFRNFLCS